MIHSATSSAKFTRLKRGIRLLLPSGIPVDAGTVCIGILEGLWHFAILNCQRGDIGRFDDDVIAEAVGWLDTPSKLLDLLVECGWLDRHAEHRLVIHDWHDHAPGFLKRNIAKKGGFVTQSSTEGGDQCELEAPKTSLDCSTEHGSGRLSAPASTEAVTPNLTKPNLTKSNTTQPALRDELVVVVSSLGVGKATEAIGIAVDDLSLSIDDIRARIEHYKTKTSPTERQPGTLYNWLTRSGSYEASRAHWEQHKTPKRADPVVELNNYRRHRLNALRGGGATQEQIEEFQQETDRQERLLIERRHAVPA